MPLLTGQLHSELRDAFSGALPEDRYVSEVVRLAALAA
jgi:hypothetical protein